MRAPSRLLRDFSGIVSPPLSRPLFTSRRSGGECIPRREIDPERQPLIEKDSPDEVR